MLAALGEMFLDKLGVFPPRYRPMLLIPHTLAGAWVAHESLKADGVDDPYAAAMGAVVAAGVAAVAPMVRMTGSKVLGIPDPLLGVVEDYLALRLGTQAMGLSMNEVTDAAKESVEGVREQVMPALQSAGIGPCDAVRGGPPASPRRGPPRWPDSPQHGQSAGIGGFRVDSG